MLGKGGASGSASTGLTEQPAGAIHGLLSAGASFRAKLTAAAPAAAGVGGLGVAHSIGCATERDLIGAGHW